MTAATKSKPKPRISPGAFYGMRVEGIVLQAFERTLFIRPDGVAVTARVSTHNGEAHMRFVSHHRVAPWRQRLARRLLGIGS